MARKISERVTQFFADAGHTMKSAAKMALQSRQCTVSRSAQPGEELLIMGNGPSLTQSLETRRADFDRCRLMAVNFAALSDEFQELKPDYYILADPVFFSQGDERVGRLHEALQQVSWPMTLFVPVGRTGISNPNIRVECFNMVAVQGYEWFEETAFRSGRGMPRPRNVLVPALMCGIRAGFKKIWLAGADHSWMSTLGVNERNEVITVQPHFYKEGPEAQQKVNEAYRGIKLHQVVYSFYLAFKSYHYIRRHALRQGVRIANITPGSMIDAFERG